MARTRARPREAVASSLLALDVAGLRLARTLGHAPPVERAVRTYSALGQHGVGWLALGVGGAALDASHRSRWRRATLTVAAAYGANQAIKLAVRRRRPKLPDLPPLIDTPTQLSFPSAHAATSFAAAHAFASLLPGAPLRAAAVAMAGSRLYLGVHYPSDIVAGVLLGATIGRIMRKPTVHPPTCP
ncbi:MAG TPA: phosphatase PAP2 family protein [Conexibacter sp.]|nr:phosphatase PAP2 family protein [Conexibacter sp.]